jgi:hypothetical protein
MATEKRDNENENYIMFGFFTKRSKDIKNLYMCNDTQITLDTYTHPDKFSLVQTLGSLPNNVWIICEIIGISEEKRTIHIRVGLTDNQEIQGLEKNNYVVDNVTDRKIVYNSFKKLIELDGPTINSLSSTGVIGIAYISIKMLKAKLLENPLSMLLSSNYSRYILSGINKKQVGNVRFLSKGLKETVDSNRSETIFNLSLYYDYSSLPDLLQLCKGYNKKPEECTFDVYFVMENNNGEVKMERDINALRDSNAKISAKFYISGDIPTNLSNASYDLLFTTIQQLPNIVYLEIDFVKNRPFFNDSFEQYNVCNALSRLTKLSSLHILNATISWIPFFNCLKQLTNLNTLLLTNIELTGSLVAVPRFAYDQIAFLREFRDVLAKTNITTIGIRDKCYVDDNYAVDEIALGLDDGKGKVTAFDVSDNEIYTADPTEFVDKFTPLMQKLVNLKSFDISFNNLGDEGLDDLLPILRSLVKLEELNLSSTQINIGMIMKPEGLLSVLNRLRYFKKLTLSDNKLSQNDIELIKERLLKKVEIINK